MTDDTVSLAPVVKNLKDGYHLRFNAEQAPTMKELRMGRIRAYGQTILPKNAADKGVEEELVNGIVVRHYN